MFVAILQRLHHSGKCFSSVSGKTLMCVLLPHSGHRRNPLVFTVMVNLLFVLRQARGDFNPDPLLQEREKHAVPATCHHDGNEGQVMTRPWYRRLGSNQHPAGSKPAAPPVVLHRYVECFWVVFYFQRRLFKRGATLFSPTPGAFTPIILDCTKILLILDYT